MTSFGQTAAGGATSIGAAGNFAQRIQTAVAAQRQAVSAKANEVKGTLATTFTSEKQSLLTGFEQMRSRMTQARDRALADLAVRGEAAKNRVRGAATAEQSKLMQALARQQQAVRQAGEDVAQAAILQATAQGDRTQQGTMSRAQRARAIGEQWASRFSALDGGAGAASDIRSKANDLAGKLASGASQGRQSCLDYGQKVATDVRSDAQNVASGMPEKLNDARARIDKERDDALKSIDEGLTGARDGITKSCEQTLQEVAGKKNEAGAAYDQLSAGAIAQVDSGLAQVLGKLDAVGHQMVTDVNEMVEGAKQYAIAPEVTADLNDGIDRTVAQYENRLEQLGGQGTSAFAGVEKDAHTAATQQTITLLAGLDHAVAGLQTSLNGKVGQTAAKVEQVATSVITALHALSQKAECDLGQGVATGRREWNKQLTEKMSALGGRVDNILSQQDGQLSKLDSDLASQYAEAKQKSEDAKRDKPWYTTAWDWTSSAVSSAFKFVAGMVVGFFEAAWELLKGLWEMLKTPLGWLLLALVVILAAIVVILFGWEALIIIGIVVGLCLAGYYVYLAVTTPGLSPYERGKLFGKALFNVVLAFAGVEFRGSNLAHFTKWGGTIPQAILLVQKLGSLSKAIELVRLVGSVRTALQLIEALGSAERVVQLVQAVGSAERLAGLIKSCGGVEKLIGLIANPKVGDAAVLARILANAKIGNVATLEKLLANAKIADVATLERLLANAKIADAAALERLLGNAKITDIATLERLLSNAKIADAALLERLLGNAKITDVATLERLLSNAKIADAVLLERLLRNAKITDVATLERLLNHAKMADAAQLEKLLDQIDTIERLDRLLNATDSGTQLLDYLTKAGGAGSAARLEDLLRLTGPGNAAKCQNLLDIAGGSTTKFQQLLTWAERLALRGAKPTYAPPPQVAAHGFSGASMPHFLDHTWEYVDLASRMNKPSTTFWPQGTPPSEIAQYLGEALDHLNPSAVAGAPPPRLPLPNVPLDVTTSGGLVQVGSNTSGAIGQFFPKNGEAIFKLEMRAIGRVLGVLP